LSLSFAACGGCGRFLSGALIAPFIQRLLIMPRFRLSVKKMLQKVFHQKGLRSSRWPVRGSLPVPIVYGAHMALGVGMPVMAVLVTAIHDDERCVVRRFDQGSGKPWLLPFLPLLVAKRRVRLLTTGTM
jgi:hypothetical protein